MGVDVAERIPDGRCPFFTAWTYDPLGNRLTETTYLGTTTFTYDLADRLVSATVGTKTESYTWSGDGLRLSATSGNGPSGTTRFQLDRSFPLPELALERDGNGKLLRRYSYGLDLLSQTTPTKGPYWSHHDGLGSVTDVTSSSGTSLWWMEYTPFGTPRASGSTSQAPVNLFRFTGAYLDTPSGLYHLRARQYDPALGRFLSVDPVSPSLADPYVGSYAYVRDNPTNRVDPSGRCVQFLASAAAGAATGPGEVLVGPASVAAFGVCVLGLWVAARAAGQAAEWALFEPVDRWWKQIEGTRLQPDPRLGSVPPPKEPGKDSFRFRWCLESERNAVRCAALIGIPPTILLQLYRQNEYRERLDQQSDRPRSTKP